MVQVLKHLSKGGRAPFQFRMHSESTERHQEPHVHVFGWQFGRVSISLIDLRIIQPPVPPAKMPRREIMEILTANRAHLLEEWAKMRREAGHDDDT